MGKYAQIAKKTIEQVRLLLIIDINLIIIVIRNNGYDPQIEIQKNIVFSTIDDQFSEIIVAVKENNVVVASDANGKIFDVPFTELSNDLLIEVLSDLETIDIGKEYPIISE